ncbi:MFS transporter [Rhodococcus sp. NBC_00297]|uniref:MFS transporter n=1 Tax=Rhodococcus sp. NBC_00297 TaxID=2976005 RepID=UPI002E2D9C9F|nr:MFS transporter [Rhodococcus sp. NBC_00297]
MTSNIATVNEFSDHLSPNRRRATIGIIAATGFIIATNSAAIPPLLPLLGTQLSLTVGQTSWALTALLLASGISALVIPRMADLRGDRWALITLPVFTTAGCAMVAFANGAVMLILGAVLVGMGIPISVAAMNAYRRLLGEEHIGRAVSAATVCVMVGSAVGGVIAGALADKVGLPATFLTLTVVSICLVITVFVVVPHMPPAEKGTVGIVSVILVAAWVVALLFGLSQGPTWGWGEPNTWITIGSAVVVAALWAMREHRLATPLVDFSVFRESAVTRAVVAGFLVGFPVTSLYVLLPMITQMDPAVASWGLGRSALATALIMAPYSLIGAVGAAICGRFVSRGYPLTVAAGGAILHLIAAVTLGFRHDSVAVLAAGAVIYGMGVGFVTAGLYGSIQRSVPPERAGMGAGVLALAQTIGGAAGPIVVSIVLARETLPANPAVPAGGAVTHAFFVAATCEVVVIAVCASGIMREVRARRSQVLRAETLAV